MILSKWKDLVNECATLLSKITSNISVMFGQSGGVNEVLLYGAGDEEQRRQAGLNNLLCIYYTMILANKSIDVCLPILRSETIFRCLINARQKSDVKIRLILYDDCKKKYTDVLKKHGVEIKVVKSTVKLEHQFILIDVTDREAVAIIGSLDYDVNHVNLNTDNTLLISDTNAVAPLKREFERIWNKSDLVNVKNI
ncbi:uncharacterized protein LOC121730587 [Aricia agestis]|uniref:uncharacterized protein LOC121730587 n=1 Tax=Aricia agestis TaxID=91739 RepID=UPI001C20AD4E|nr:uncharacterized protein LOC121730587 [Aricia agestis]